MNSILLLLVLSSQLLVLSSAAQKPPKEPPLVRAKRIEATLIEGGALKGRTFKWGQTTYDVPESWQLCQAYAGICFKAAAPGAERPVVLAVFESQTHVVDLIEVDYEKYRKDRTQEALHYFIKGGATLQRVFELRDAKGRLLFTPAGQLTPEGDAAYEASLRGTDAGLTTETAKAPPPKRKGCPHAAAVKKINKLRNQGYVEFEKEEYDCLRSYFAKYSEEEINAATVCDETKDRYFYLKKDDMDDFIVQSFRKNKKCPSKGQKLFGHE